MFEVRCFDYEDDDEDESQDVSNTLPVFVR
jgi:hypothetical protein